MDILESDLLLNCCSNGWHKVGWVQVEIVAKNLSKLLCVQHSLISVPEERVPQLLTLDVHVEPDGDEDLWLSSILMHSAGIGVIEAEGESPHLLVQNPAKHKYRITGKSCEAKTPVSVDGSGLRHCVKMGTVGHCCHSRWGLDDLGLVQLRRVTVASIALELVIPVKKKIKLGKCNPTGQF